MVLIFHILRSNDDMAAKTVAKSGLIQCSRCRRTFQSVSVRRCPHPAVAASYGRNLCYFCCMHCHYHVKQPLCGAIGCGYEV